MLGKVDMNRGKMGRPYEPILIQPWFPPWLALALAAWVAIAAAIGASDLLRAEGASEVLALAALMGLPPLGFGLAYTLSQGFRSIVLSWDTRMLFVLNALRLGGFATLLLAMRDAIPWTWAVVTTSADLLLALWSILVAVGGYKSMYRIVSWGWAMLAAIFGLFELFAANAWLAWLVASHERSAYNLVSFPYALLPAVFVPLLGMVQLAAIFKLVYASSPPDRLPPKVDNIFSPNEFPYALPFNLTSLSQWYIRTAYLALRPLKYLIMNNWFDVSRNYPRAAHVFPALFETGDKIARLIDDIAGYGLARAQPPYPDFTFQFDAGKKDWEATWTTGPEASPQRFDIEETMFWAGYMHYKFGSQPGYLQFAADNLGQGVFNIFLGNQARHQINERVNPKTLGDAHADGMEIRGLRGYRIFLFLHWLRRYFVWAADQASKVRWFRITLWRTLFGSQPPESYASFHRRELNEVIHQADAIITLLVDPLVHMVYRLVQSGSLGIRHARSVAIRQSWDAALSKEADEISDAFHDGLDARIETMIRTLTQRGGAARVAQAQDLERFRQALCRPAADSAARRKAQRRHFRERAEWLMHHVTSGGHAAKIQLQDWGAQLYDAGWPAFAWDAVREALDETLLPVIQRHYGEVQDTSTPYPRKSTEDPTQPMKSFNKSIDPRLADSWDQLFVVVRSELMLGAKARSGYNPTHDPPEVAWHRSHAGSKGSTPLD